MWQTQALSSSAIPTCLLELRKALGDTSSPHKIIQTVRGRGYRFVATLRRPRALDSFADSRSSDLTFTGRDFELDQLLRETEAAAINHRSATLAVRGNPGFGKTRLLQEYVRALPGSIEAYVVRCPELEGAPPFHPWQLLWTQLFDESNSDLKPYLKSAQPQESARQQPGERVHISRDRVVERFALFDAWSRLLRIQTRSGPLVLIFEDIHRTDTDSVDLLRWVAEDLVDCPLILAYSYRPPTSKPSQVSSLSKLSTHHTCTTITLTPLEVENVLALVSDRLAEPERVAQLLHQKTAGIPFFLQRLILDPGSGLHEADSRPNLHSLNLPNEDVITHQLGSLPAMERRALETGSIFGSTFPIDSASRVAGCERSIFLQRLETARRSEIILDSHENSESLHFAHTILRDALYEALPAETRRRLHTRAADSIIELNSNYVGSMAGIVADHLSRGLPVSDTDRLAKFSRLAGQHCISTLAFSDASSYLLRAKEIVDVSANSTAERRVSARIELAQAQIYAGDRAAGRRSLLDAARIARDFDLPELIAKSALGISPDYLSIEVGPYDSELVDLLYDCLERMCDECSPLRAQVMARLSLALAWSRSPESRARFALEAVSLAKRVGDPAAIAAALSARSDALHGPDRVIDRLKTNAELRHAVRRTGDRPGKILCHIRQIAALLDCGDIHGVDCEIAACEASVLEMNVPQFSWYPTAFRAMRELMKGRLESANRLGETFLSVGKRSKDVNVDASRACQLCMILVERGQSRQAVSFGEEFVARFPNVRAWAAGLGYVYLHAGDMKRALSTLDSFDTKDIASLFRETAGSAGVAFLAEIAIGASDTGRMAEIYDLISALGSRSATLGFGMGYFGCFGRIAGMLAQSLGLESEAVEHLRSAVATERHRGADLWTTHSELNLADALLSLEGGASEGATLLQASALEARRLGLRRAHLYYERVARRKL